MPDIKITAVEGQDQFHVEGNEETAKQLLTEWRARVDALKADARTYMDRMLQEHGDAPPTGPQIVGPGGSRGGPTPFGRRS